MPLPSGFDQHLAYKEMVGMTSLGRHLHMRMHSAFVHSQTFRLSMG